LIHFYKRHAQISDDEGFYWIKIILILLVGRHNCYCFAATTPALMTGK